MVIYHDEKCALTVRPINETTVGRTYESGASPNGLDAKGTCGKALQHAGAYGRQ